MTLYGSVNLYFVLTKYVNRMDSVFDSVMKSNNPFADYITAVLFTPLVTSVALNATKYYKQLVFSPNPNPSPNPSYSTKH